MVPPLPVSSRASARWWPERLAPILALGGVLAASLPNFHPYIWQDSGSDFKTLYASSRLFNTGRLAYNFPNLGDVFHANGVVPPGSWYAHAPTYPPFTLVTLAPIAALPMVPAVYLWMVLSTIALVAAMWAMTSLMEREFALGRFWRLLLIALVAASPLVSFGLQIGNVSVMASALCILALMAPTGTHPNWRAVALTVSLLLKPHIALWLLVAMFFSRNRSDRALVWRTAAFSAATITIILLSTLAHPFGAQLGDYTHMVTSEIATGCLNPRNHELLPPAAEITSIQSLFGFGLDHAPLQIFTILSLATLAGALVFASRRFPAEDSAARLELFGAWSTFGLLVTYHRTHDGVILFFLLPWLLFRLSRRLADPLPWTVIAAYCFLAIGGFPPTFDWIAQIGFPELSRFFVFRQSAVGTVILQFLLIADLLTLAPLGHPMKESAPLRSVAA